jgi:GNAT superfamily N-acetyltransferase
MTDFQNLVIEPLNTTHDRADFHCDVEALDRYIHRQAGQDIKRRISRVFAAALPDNPKKVIGYYSLSTLSIELNQLPEKLARKLPKHPVPAALIGRLAVSKTAQGHGVGKMLLADAVKRTLSVSVQIAIYAMVVDAIDDKAKGFYEQFGFARLSDDSPRLFLPLKSIYQILPSQRIC